MAGGQVQIVSDLQSHGRVGGSVPYPDDGGGEKVGNAVAATFSKMGDQIGKLADHAAKVEGEDAGRLAGMDPEFRTRRDQTIRGEAFDKAGLQVAESRLKVQLDDHLERLYDQHGTDPAALAKGIDEVAAGVLAHAPDELRPGLELQVSHKRLGFMRQAARDQAAKVAAEQAAATAGELGRLQRQLYQQAYGLGGDASADDVASSTYGQIQELLKRTGVNGKPIISPLVAQKELERTSVEFAEARMLGTFSRLETPAQKVEFIQKLEQDWAAGEGIAKHFTLDQFRSVRTTLEGELRRQESGRNVVARAIERDIKEVADAAAKGYAPKPEELAALRARIAASGDPALVAHLDTAEATLKWQNGARRASPMELEQWIEAEDRRLSKDGYQPHSGEIARLEMGRKILGEMRKQLGTDPLGWADKVGRPDVTPLDFKSPDTLVTSLRARVPQGDQVASDYDRPAVYIRPEEKRRLVAMAAPGGKALLEVAEAISRGAGDKAGAIFHELWNDRGLAGAHSLALIGGHIQNVGSTAVVQDVADGLMLAKSKDWKGPTLSEREQRENALGAHGGALAGMPANERALIDATNYAYAVRLQRTGKTGDNNLWQRTFRELMGERTINGETWGGVTTWRGKSVPVPPDVKQDGLGDLIKTITPEDFGEDRPRNAKGYADAAQIRGAILVPLPGFRYRLNVGSAEDPLWLNDGSGRPFEMDLQALKPKLQERRPDLYIDGAGAGAGVSSRLRRSGK